MSTIYEIRSGGRSVSVRDGSTAQEAVIDYVRSLGCATDEIVRVASDAVAWRGAVFSAVPAASTELETRNAA